MRRSPKLAPGPQGFLRVSLVELRIIEWIFGGASERVSVFFAGADAHSLLERIDENLAVADLAGTRRGGDRFDHLIDHVGVDRDFDFQLGQKAHRVFSAAINFSMPLLPSITFDFRHRQPVYPDGRERVAHLLQFERLDYCHHYFHLPHPSLAAGAPQTLTRRPARWRPDAREARPARAVLNNLRAKDRNRAKSMKFHNFDTKRSESGARPRHRCLNCLKKGRPRNGR